MVSEHEFVGGGELRLTYELLLKGLMLAASVDDEEVCVPKVYWSCTRLTNSQVESQLAEVKSQAKMIFRRLNRNSEPQASIESGAYSLQ